MSIKIFIDQGHNPSGHNQGAAANGLIESDITYNVGIYLRDMLNADGRFTARTSRITPNEVLGWDNSSSLQVRVNMANTWPADYFLSIHGNANLNPNINGSEMYIYSTQGQAFPLAQNIMRGITARVNTRDNGIHLNQEFYVLRRTSMPAVLVELAYLTNIGDAELLRCCQYGFALGIYGGLLSYFGLLPPELDVYGGRD